MRAQEREHGEDAGIDVWTITDIGQGWSEISTVPPAAPGRPEVMCMEKYWWQANMWNCHRPDWQLWQSLG